VSGGSKNTLQCPVSYERFSTFFCLKILNPHMGLLREIQLEIEKRSLSRGGSVLAR